MSVILDALHKARSDRRHGNTGPHEQAVAKVLDAAAVDAAATPTAKRSSFHVWLLAFGIIMGLLVFFALAAGAFVLIYQQLKEIGGSVTTATAVSNNPPVHSPVDAIQAVTIPPAEALPTPVPLSDLPVQSPVANAPATATQAASPALTAADFTLGAIACENGDCIATLNGRTARVGDVFKGHEVIAINEISVQLKAVDGSSELTLSLFD